MMSPEEMRKKAIDLFTRRFHCSQAVLAVGQEKIGRVDKAVIRAMGSFGGGVAGSGMVCGALTGGIALISTLYSRGDLDEKEDPRMWFLSHRFIKRFRELTESHGGVDCSDIARVDWKDHVAVKDFYTNPESRRKICIQLVGDAAFALGELLEEEEAKEKQAAQEGK
jgi:C_GCAxxG_C_C family probable redox protein